MAKQQPGFIQLTQVFNTYGFDSDILDLRRKNGTYTQPVVFNLHEITFESLQNLSPNGDNPAAATRITTTSGEKFDVQQKIPEILKRMAAAKL